MSTGANCTIYEKEPRKWYYDLQRWPYGDSPEYDTFGPFPHFKATREHLSRNHANPGGWSKSALPGCAHDMLADRTDEDASCDRCGDRITTLQYPEWKKRVLALFRKNTKQSYSAVFGRTDAADAKLREAHRSGDIPEYYAWTLVREARMAKPGMTPSL